MQNLKISPSSSDSQRPSNPPQSDNDYRTTPHGGEQVWETLALLSQIDPTIEPDFLSGDHLPDDLREPASRALILAHNVPSPEESTVQEPTTSVRSWRLQWRYLRTLVFAAGIFARVLFWQIYVNKVAPDYVKRTEMARWTKYTREFSRFAAGHGGVFIKLGQFISTRVDILPEQIIKELVSLQDEVPTIDFRQIQAVIEREIGDVDAHFAHVDPQPIAAASLGQVHRAELKSGENVVIKVQRPNIREICYTDLAAMRVIAKVAMRFRFISRRSDASALVEEFGQVLLQELSYKHEAYNAARFMDMFRHHRGVTIPVIYYGLSTDQVLTMEDVTAIKITDFEALERAGINRKAVAQRLMDTYLDQVFNHYFFHADPHPGNLFIRPLGVAGENADFGAEGRPFSLVFIDFGMTGTLTRTIADGLVSTVYCVLTRDVEGMIRCYQELGFLLPGADIDRITEAASSAFDKVWGLSFTQLQNVNYDQMVDLAEEFGDLMLTMPFYIPQDFIYLGRTISILSGMATSLDPQFNPWYELQPYAEQLIARGFGIDIAPNTRIFTNDKLGLTVFQSLFNGNGGKVIRALADEVLRRTLGTTPRNDPTLAAIQRGELRVVTDLSVAHRQQLRRIEKANLTTARAVFFGSVLIASTLFYVNGDTVIALVGWLICLVTMLTGVMKE